MIHDDDGVRERMREWRVRTRNPFFFGFWGMVGRYFLPVRPSDGRRISFPSQAPAGLRGRGAARAQHAVRQGAGEAGHPVQDPGVGPRPLRRRDGDHGGARGRRARGRWQVLPRPPPPSDCCQLSSTLRLGGFGGEDGKRTQKWSCWPRTGRNSAARSTVGKGAGMLRSQKQCAFATPSGWQQVKRASRAEAPVVVCRQIENLRTK